MLKHLSLTAVAATALVAAPLITWAAAPAPAPVAVAPMHSSGATPAFPRLTKFPDAKIMAKVNKLLAGKEKEDHDWYKECVGMVKDAGRKPDADTYTKELTVRYVSTGYLGIDAVMSSDCAGAYPTNGAEQPITINLSTGEEIDWSTAFKPGFLSNIDKDPPVPGVLTKYYRAHYRKPTDGADECVGWVMKEQDPFSSTPIVWLDAKAGGIVVQPDYPHAMAACADPVTIPVSVIGPYLKDAKLAADLKANVKPK